MSKKKCCILSAMMSATLALTGCQNTEKKEAEMLAHMYEKYGVELQVEGFAETIHNDSYDRWYCTVIGESNLDEKEQINVNRWRNREENKFSDDYYPVVIRAEVESRVNKKLEEILVEYKMYVKSTGSYVDNKYSSLEQYEEYLEEKGNDCACYVVKVILHDCGSEAANEKLVQQVLENLREANIGNPYMNVFCMTEDKYEEITRENISYIKTSDYTYRYGGELDNGVDR